MSKDDLNTLKSQLYELKEKQNAMNDYFDAQKEVMQLKIQLCKESLQYEVESHQKKKDECLNKLNELQKDIDKIRTDYQKQKKDQDSLLSGERIAHLHTEIGNLKKDNHIFDIEIDVLKSKISVYDARLSQTKKDVCYIVYVTNN